MNQKKSVNVSNYPTLENGLFGAVKVTKHADVDQNKYSGYGIGFNRKRFFSHPSGGDGKNVIIFGVGLSLSTKIDNRKKDILILGKSPTQGLEHTLSAKKKKKECIQLILLKKNKVLFEFALQWSRQLIIC